MVRGEGGIRHNKKQNYLWKNVSISFFKIEIPGKKPNDFPSKN